jgi:transposase-like protein
MAKAIIKTEVRVCYFAACPTCGSEVDLEHTGLVPKTDDEYTCTMCLRDFIVTWETDNETTSSL